MTALCFQPVNITVSWGVAHYARSSTLAANPTIPEAILEDDPDWFTFVTMAEPDELYTLRAQFALGHYGLALQESKQVARRPMSAALQAEREEYAVRALTALRQYAKIEEGDRPGKASLRFLKCDPSGNMYSLIQCFL
jgi:hypothetical protein